MSEQAKTAWKYIIGISAIIGLLVFLGINFVNMFSYLSYIGPFAIVSYILWIAISLLLFSIEIEFTAKTEVNIIFKILIEAVLSLIFGFIYVIGINSYNDSGEAVVFLNRVWCVVSLFIHAGLLYLLCFACHKLKEYIIKSYVQKQINRNIKFIDEIITDNTTAESIATIFLKDTYYLSNFITLINSLQDSSNSNQLRESFLRKNEKEYQKHYNTLLAKVPESYRVVFPKKYEDLLGFSDVTSKHKSRILQIREKFENANRTKEVVEIETELTKYLNGQQILLSKGDEN